MKEDFNPWPCGKVPEKWQRPEIKLVKEKYNVDDMGIIDLFEKKIAEHVGSKYGVAISSATNAIFLSLLYLKSIGKYHGGLEERNTITMPSRTYMSVPMSILNAGLKVKFENIEWSGVYRLKPTVIWDCAGRFRKNMYTDIINKGEGKWSWDALCCLSFQYKKRLPIGRGGMILTNDRDVRDWLIQARFNGRHPDIDQWHDTLEVVGWNMYMTPDDAARGILIFDELEDDYPDNQCYANYPDLSKQKIFQ